MAAGSLCGIVITRLLIGSVAAHNEDTSVTASAAALINNVTTRFTTHAATTRSLVNVLVNQVRYIVQSRQCV